ncbi:MAG: adenosylcobalamin-dependent ribonucleoside-diphosphate reductase, partial [Clostridia bacterium]
MSHPQPHIDRLLTDRYYLRDEEGNLLETEPHQMYRRVAFAIAQAEGFENCAEWTDKFYFLMHENKFLPNTPTLINAGKDRPGSFSACFVLPVEDSMEGIFKAVKDAAIIMKAGGGVGFNFGRLREKGAIVKTTGHESSGPISFMKVFDSACETISQGGVRRGAMIGILPVWHPDIEEFIKMKDDGASFSNFNISVGITDDFMKAVEEDRNYFLYHYLNDPGTEPIQIKARDLWNQIIEHAHKTGDPGLFFLDTVNKAHPLEEDIESPNPCGEIPLRAYESCNLGSINLMAYIKEIQPNTEKLPIGGYEFNWYELEKDIPTMVRFLDDVIDVNPFPLPEIEKASKESRKIGLGIMGWADCLIKMKIPYDSEEAIKLAEELMYFIDDNAYLATQELAREKGSYPLCKEEDKPSRNATLLTIAPTGTLSRIAGVSSGIEPIFAWKIHHKLADREYDEEHWSVKDWEEHPTVRYPNWLKTASEIGSNWHLRMQAAFQKYVDNSISKTINLPNDAPVDTVHEIYRRAWEMGLKGITIYRDGSKEHQPLNKIEAELPSTVEEGDIIFSIIEPRSSLRKRGPVAIGVTHKVDTGRGKIYITINYSEYHAEPVEVFIRLGHLSTPTEAALAEWSGRLISLLLKYNVPLESVMRQGNKVYADTTFWYNKQSFCSLPKLISHLLGFTFEEALDMADLDFDSFLENGDEYYEENEAVEEKSEI